MHSNGMKGFVHSNFFTPMLGSAPVPSFPKGLFEAGSESAADFDTFAQCLLSIFLTWKESAAGET